MDAGTLYLRFFLGATPFRSSELDSLAESMGVSNLLSGDPAERYFLTKTNAAALCLGNKVLFGASYYSTLTESQRLAVTAHEFGHVLGEGVRTRNRLVAPSVAVPMLLALAVFLGTGSVLALMSAAVLGFITAAAVWRSSDSEQYLKHEMSCDMLAAAFVEREALVEAIHVAESLRGTRRGRLASLWKRVGANPSTKLRIDAIMGQKVAS